MLRLTRGALTMLLAQYRAVLSHAYLKNISVAAVAGLFCVNANSDTYLGFSDSPEALINPEGSVEINGEIELSSDEYENLYVGSLAHQSDFLYISAPQHIHTVSFSNHTQDLKQF